MKNALVIIVGVSGAGKSTIADELKKRFPNEFKSVITTTTRPPRVGEINDVHYHFRSLQQFQEMKANQEFLETANVHGNMYGTSIAALEAVLLNSNALLIVDYYGAISLK